MQANSQKYAAAVYGLVEPLQKWDRKQQKRYGKLCHDFPFIVRENGLAAAFAFLLAKSKEEDGPEGTLLQHYAEMLEFKDGPDALHKGVIAAELAEYRRLTQKSLQLAEWFKRYAEGVLKVSSTGDDVEDKAHD